MTQSHQVEEYTKEISEKEFQTILSNNELIIIDCFAKWCSPCIGFKPIFEELSNKYTSIKFISIDTDETRWISNRYDIDSIPRFLFFKNRQMIYEHKGASPKEVFEYFIQTKLLNLHLLDEYNQGMSELEFDSILKKDSQVLVEFHPLEHMESEQLKPFYIPLMKNHPDITLLLIAMDNKKTTWAKKRFNIEAEFPHFVMINAGEVVFSGHIHHPDAVKYTIEEKFYGRSPFTHAGSMPEEKFDTIIGAHDISLVFVMQEGSRTSEIMRNYLFRVGEQFPDLPLIALKTSENPWLKDKFALEDGEFTRYGENGKKTPYFLFYKNGRIVHETGPVVPAKFEDIIQAKLLKMHDVEEFDHGIDERKFNAILEENSLVVVDIFTTWCQPCTEMRPIFRDISRKHLDYVRFLSIDLDQALWIGQKFNVDSIPSFLFFKNGKLVHKHVGFLEEDLFEKKIQEHFK